MTGNHREKKRFLSARRLEEALNYRDEFKEARVIAGGTDVLVNLRKKNGPLSRTLKGLELLDISNLVELKYIRLVERAGSLSDSRAKPLSEEKRQFELGALVTHTRLIENSLVKEHLPLLVEAAGTIGSTQIRNRATLGGNICNASPAGDLIPPLLAYGAEVVLSSGERERILPLKEFIIGPYRTALAGDELLTMVRVPVPAKSYRGNFQKIGRRQALNIARLNLALLVELSPEGIILEARAVPGAATPYPCRFPAIEQKIQGEKITALNLDEIGELAAGEMVSITGERWSTPYKKMALATLVRRGLEEIRDKWLKEGGENGEI